MAISATSMSGLSRLCPTPVSPRPRRVSSSPSQRTGGINIRSARVAGVEIPNSKRIEISLQYIHGVGKTMARQILLNVGLDNKITKELSEEELTKIREEINSDPQTYRVEGDLRRDVFNDIKRLKDIQCYRGKRHIMGLPCRGQHTKCNARTRKGKKITVAGKKKASK